MTLIRSSNNALRHRVQTEDGLDSHQSVLREVNLSRVEVVLPQDVASHPLVINRNAYLHFNTPILATSTRTNDANRNAPAQSFFDTAARATARSSSALTTRTLVVMLDDPAQGTPTHAGTPA